MKKVLLVIGLMLTSHLYLSETVLKGYITGVAYISNCTPNVTRNERSRYLVVIALMINPDASPSEAIINTATGKNKNGLPFGLHIMAPLLREDILFTIGKDFEKQV